MISIYRTNLGTRGGEGMEGCESVCTCACADCQLRVKLRMRMMRGWIAGGGVESSCYSHACKRTRLGERIFRAWKRLEVVFMVGVGLELFRIR